MDSASRLACPGAVSRSQSPTMTRVGTLSSAASAAERSCRIRSEKKPHIESAGVATRSVSTTR
jgi:hypothetical protein